MELSGLEPLTCCRHAVAKSLVSNNNYRVYDNIFTWLSAGISAF
tara:strand:- start:136 stop:267 length:132 start_codon:yes stop_codon:yes gene_type:complete